MTNFKAIAEIHANNAFHVMREMFVQVGFNDELADPVQTAMRIDILKMKEARCHFDRALEAIEKA